jgi:pectin methylesterase-like acyl-CoA thioesterase
MVTESLRIAAVGHAAPVRTLVRRMAFSVLAMAFPAGVSAFAQAPVPLPNTIATVAGGASTSGGSITGGVLPAKGAACSAGSPYTATDAYGDGCPGINTAFSSDFRGGLQVDGFGNVFIMDSTNSLLRKIDARSGLVTAVTGTALTGCTTSSDGYGDGCPLAETKLGTARGVNIDPYGNVVIAGYNMDTINIICNAVSPLCPNTANRKQVGSMYRIAGCVASATAAGTSGSGGSNGTAGDGFAASPYGNLSGDVADWNPGNVTNDGITGYGSCTAANTLGAVLSPRGVAADKYGNVYIAETGSGTTGARYRVVVGPASFTLPNGTVLSNPMAGIIALDPAYSTITATSAYGKIYPILGGFTSAATGVTPPTTIGSACAGSSGGSTLDKIGDGCPFYESTSATGQQGLGVDAEGNVIFSDNSESIVRVLYVGTTVAMGATTSDPMALAIRAANANPTLPIVQGYVYPIMGAINSGVTNSSLTSTPTLGTTTTLDSDITKVALDPSGDIYIGDFSSTSYVLFFDIKTGYARKLIASGTPCTAKLDSVGDGCPANQSNFGGQSAGLGIGISPEGDLYIADDSNLLIRKVTASNLIPVTLGSTLTQTVILHGAPGTTNITAQPTIPSPDISIGTATCPAANADGSLDCTAQVTFAPLSPGLRSTVMLVTSLGVSGQTGLPVAGIANGSALAVDSSAPVVVPANGPGAVSAPVSLAVDGEGDVFTMSTGSGKVVKLLNGNSQQITATLPASPYQIAVDTYGNVYATGTGSSTITRLTPTVSGAYQQTSISYVPPTLPASPYGIVVDRNGNLLVADRTNEAVYSIPLGDQFEALNPLSAVVGGFTGIGQLALDGGGNLFIADPGANAVKRLLAGATATTTIATSVNPSYIAADAAGDLYVQDATAKTVTEYPLAPTAMPVQVYSFTGTAEGIAVDSTGVLYEADSTATAINAIQRQNATYNFGTSTTATFAGTVTDIGNSAATGVNQTDSADFQVVAGSTHGCNVAGAQAIGTACTISATFTPQCGTGNVSDIFSLLPAIGSSGMLTLMGTKNGSAVTTTTSIGGQTPTSPVYVASGTEVTFTVTVAAACGGTGNASGSVAVTVDSNTPVTYNLNSSGQAVVALSGLVAGSHTISASYATQNGFTGSSTTSPTSFTIAQAATTLTWSPSATTQQYSQAIGAAVLDATASSGGVTVPGYVIYTATPAGGSASPIHSASFLPINTYSLSATFVPNDAVDFSGATGTIASYTVTKATTSAPVGATQMLVAADGTGNYTSVQAAINAIPTTGGNVYIKPGTYSGDVTVVQSNLSMRGLGGDPTQVVITHAGGAFGGSGVYQYAGEFTAAQNNGSQLPSGSTVFTGDEASATLVVAKGVNTAVSTSTLTPNSFYADNLTLSNTYDTDNVTTTTTQVSSGACTANAGPAMTYFALYNAGTLCASQALAIWTTADLSVMNNVYTTSLQDTIYSASQGAGSNGYVPARQYWFRGKVTGDVDFIFGDAATVFDYTTIYTAFHGTTATGTETIEAQNKMHQTDGTGDYLSGYIMNSDVLTSQAPGMTQLYFGRPYGPYSTWIMLNTYVDQVNPLGYIEFSGDTNLPTSTYAEYNDIAYTDPTTGSADINGVIYSGSGGNSGTGVTGTREATSTDPGTLEGNNTVKTTLTQAEAQQYFPANFLGTTVSSTLSSTANWNPNTAIAGYVNGFTGTGTSAAVAGGSSVTILMRPQTPGLGAITNGTYTIPTGTYTLTDTFGGNAAQLATGSLDASGEAYFTSSSLAAGTHNLTWTYSGDSNFSGSTTASAFVLTVTGINTTTTLGTTTNPITYGQSATITTTVTPASGMTSPTGSVTLTIDGGATQNAILSGSTASFTVTGLQAGTHSFSASYAGGGFFNSSSTTSNLSLGVNQAALTVTGVCANRQFGQVNVCSANVMGYQYTDSAATVFAGTPTGTTTVPRDQPAGTGNVASALTSSLTLTTFGSTNYSITTATSTFTITGGAAQSILFAPLPNFPHGSSYQLTARTTSGLPVTYSITAGGSVASVSGSVLTVSGTSTTVTVQATMSADPTGDYAPATPVSVSFTPQ